MPISCLILAMTPLIDAQCLAKLQLAVHFPDYLVAFFGCHSGLSEHDGLAY